MQLYDGSLKRIEENVTKLLEERLGNCKTADEMFRVFSTFKLLFFRWKYDSVNPRANL